MAKEWSKTPAELIGQNHDPWVAWCVNEAVFMFGRHVEHEMSAAEGTQTKPAQRNAARQRALTAAIEGPVRKGKVQGQFKDPAQMFN